MPHMAVIQNVPTAVAPKTNQDIVTLVRFAEKHKISLIQELHYLIAWTNGGKRYC
jgi:hypothetical protein